MGEDEGDGELGAGRAFGRDAVGEYQVVSVSSGRRVVSLDTCTCSPVKNLKRQHRSYSLCSDELCLLNGRSTRLDRTVTPWARNTAAQEK